MINIKGIDKARVLYALWHASHTQGMSFLGLPKGNFTIERAREIIKERNKSITNVDYRLYFDYVDGHVIKCNISGDEFDERLFDRDCGIGAAQKAIDDLLASNKKMLRRNDAINYNLASLILKSKGKEHEFQSIKDWCELIKDTYSSMPDGKRLEVILSIRIKDFLIRIAKYCGANIKEIIRPTIDLPNEFFEAEAKDSDEIFTSEKAMSALSEIAKYHPGLYRNAFMNLYTSIKVHEKKLYIEEE